MSIAFWRQEYVTGIDEIDQQHQSLFKIINNLHEAMIEGHGNDLLLETLNKLTIYTDEHFKTEEEIMLKYQYPFYDEHKAMHDQLRHEVVNLKAKMENKETFLTVEVSRFLTEWLIHHIKGDDFRLINFVKEQCFLEKKLEI